MTRKSTKIVATLGPATDSPIMLKQLIAAGMNVARLNFSHSNYDYFTTLVAHIRSASTSLPIMLDTKGPEVRLGKVDGTVILEKGTYLTLKKKEVMGTAKEVTITYPYLERVPIESTILIDDGLIEATVISASKEELVVKINNEGPLSSNKSVAFRDHNVILPFLSEKDKKDIAFGVEKRVDFIAASFVRTQQDILDLRALLQELKAEYVKIIAKIEHWQAVENLDEIIASADGIMVARGDLGVEMNLWEVPKIQQEIVKKCNSAGKPVIVATQMLESMKENPRPTRAEVHDVAQAILQGTDAIMLSGETTVGKYPLQAVKMMSTIAQEYEQHTPIKKIALENVSVSGVIAYAAALATEQSQVTGIITLTKTGKTARLLASAHPKAIIHAVTGDKAIYRQLQLSRGVYPLLVEDDQTPCRLVIQKALAQLLENKSIKSTDQLIITSGEHKAWTQGTHVLEIFCAQDLMKDINTFC